MENKLTVPKGSSLFLYSLFALPQKEKEFEKGEVVFCL